MNDMNALLSKLAAKLEEEGADEEADEVRKLLEEHVEEPNVETEKPEAHTERGAEVSAECPSCGCHMVGTMSAVETPEDHEPKLDVLASLADKLDSMGLTKEADDVDGLMKKLAADVKWQKNDLDPYDAKKNNEQTFKANKPVKEKETKHHVPEYQETKDKSLSTRYCPLHIGSMLHRVGEGIYRCDLCGKDTNWADFGSIANQTSSTTNVPIANRFLDPAQETLGRGVS
jgi:ribosomal protein L37AE/L43A